MRVIVALACLFGSSSVVTADEDVPNYWPLEVGNKWICAYPVDSPSHKM